jgi:threonine synthase
MSAVGIKAAEAVDCLNETSVCLATAHPAKFPEATTKLDGIKEVRPTAPFHFLVH